MLSYSSEALVAPIMVFAICAAHPNIATNNSSVSGANPAKGNASKNRMDSKIDRRTTLFFIAEYFMYEKDTTQIYKLLITSVFRQKRNLSRLYTLSQKIKDTLHHEKLTDESIA